jgi:hypothetical protein
MKFALTWDFAGNIIAQEKLLKAFIGVVRCFPSNWGYFLKYILFKNILIFLYFLKIIFDINTLK